MKRGLMLGRFLPPHAGHLFAGESAQALVDELTILICARPDDAVSGELRLAWLRALFPQAQVLLEQDVPPDAPDDPAFWSAWGELLRRAHPDQIDIFFAPQRFGSRLALEVGAWPAVIDPAHATIPISSHEVRERPIEHWRFLPPPVRPHYAKTICLHGPESTGKSTMAPKLAAHFETLYVPEYGRTHCESFGLALTMEDLLVIGRTHCAMTQAALRQCNKRLILDRRQRLVEASRRAAADDGVGKAAAI